MESNIPAEYPSKPWQPLFDYLAGLCEIPPTLSEMEDLMNVVEKMIGHKSLQARCDRYEKALKEIAEVHAYPNVVARKALNREGEEAEKAEAPPAGPDYVVCQRCKQERATRQYSDLYVCEHCDTMLNNEFDEEYR
jgi:hypothetical protein